MESAIVRWYDEVKKYRFDGESFISGTGHFTQVCQLLQSYFVWSWRKLIAFLEGKSMEDYQRDIFLFHSSNYHFLVLDP